MIDKLKKIMMVVSMLFVVICFIASIVMALILPEGDANVYTFYFFALIFFAASVWMAMNVYNVFNSGKK